MMVVDGDKGKDKDRDVQYPIMGICAVPCGQLTKKHTLFHLRILLLILKDMIVFDNKRPF